ncbi:Uma2 family endonuclease [Euzebya sp.]|uniref:Uma2 family endonuclease n=1 Tax=Euzebya sp. TaxID=1971409 RepID=UPI003518FA2F
MTDVRVRPLKRVEYDLLVDHGALGPEDRVELLDGMLVEMSPQGSRHAAVITRLTEILVLACAGGPYEVRPQVPFAASDVSEPEPDFAIVRRDHGLGHPAAAELVIEVAESSRALDLGRKARIYAAAGVPTYWVVDLQDRVIHVHTEPGSEGYGRVATATSATSPALGIDVDLAELP